MRQGRCRMKKRQNRLSEGQMPEIDIHTDDYALTVNTSKDILECMKTGSLDSISIMPNMSCTEECVMMLYKIIPDLPFLPKMSVHLNFVEGQCLTKPEEIPYLTRRGEQMMGLSWGGLFRLSYLPWKRYEAKKQLKKEIKAQIEAAWKIVRKCMEIAKAHGIPCLQKELRIDSHQHAHMIPVVWEALTEVISEEDYRVEYIRNSKEVLGAFLADLSLWKTYQPINFIKNRLLSLYSYKVDRYARTHSMMQMYFWGLIMSGHMDYDRIVRLYRRVTAKAKKDHRTLEISFHVGSTLPEEVTKEIGETAARNFYLKTDRQVERETVMKLRKFAETGPLI